MANITELTQNVNNGDTIDEKWFDAVGAAIASLRQDLANTQQQLEQVKSQVTGALVITLGGGLRLNVSQGSVTLPNRSVVVIPSSNVQAIAGQKSYIYVDELGEINVGTSTPRDGLLELGEASANATEVTLLTNYPRLKVNNPSPDPAQLASKEYVDENKFKVIAQAKKTSNFPIPRSDLYYIIPFEELEGEGFNTAGVYTAQENGKIVIHAKIRVDTTRPDLYRDLSIKLSAFDINSELGTPLQQVESADGDVTLNAWTQELTVAAGNVFTLRIYISFRNRQVSTSDRIRVRENSIVSIYRV